jgi:RimJ/RimL family protein N-acetyltransferase
LSVDERRRLDWVELGVIIGVEGEAMSIIIREASGEDVHGIIGYMKELAAEPDLYTALTPGEFNVTVEAELKWIEDHTKGASSLLLLAVDTGSDREKWDLEDGEMVGLMNCSGATRHVFRHITTLGISMKAGWRGQGIGSKMMRQAIEWARESGVVTRIQLEVIEENVEARELYERLGFVVEGVLKESFWKWDRKMDSLLMALLL